MSHSASLLPVMGTVRIYGTLSSQAREPDPSYPSALLTHRPRCSVLSSPPHGRQGCRVGRCHGKNKASQVTGNGAKILSKLQSLGPSGQTGAKALRTCTVALSLSQGTASPTGETPADPHHQHQPSGSSQLPALALKGPRGLPRFPIRPIKQLKSVYLRTPSENVQPKRVFKRVSLKLLPRGRWSCGCVRNIGSGTHDKAPPTLSPTCHAALDKPLWASVSSPTKPKAG